MVQKPDWDSTGIWYPYKGLWSIYQIGILLEYGILTRVYGPETRLGFYWDMVSLQGFMVHIPDWDSTGIWYSYKGLWSRNQIGVLLGYGILTRVYGPETRLGFYWNMVFLQGFMVQKPDWGSTGIWYPYKGLWSRNQIGILLEYGILTRVYGPETRLGFYWDMVYGSKFLVSFVLKV